MQKLYILLLFTMVVQFSCTTPDKSFPERNAVLIEDFANDENFFPITQLDLSSKGIKEKLPIIFVFFDPSNKAPFPPMSDVDHISFSMEADGKCIPEFSKEVLHINDDYKEYLTESIAKYEQVKKAHAKASLFVNTEAPEWWQDDETPLNSKGEPCMFVCQVDVYDLTADDCRMYVFYDKLEKKIKCIYQRT